MSEKLKHGYRLPAAGEEDIRACEARLKVKFPEDYRAFLLASNGFNDDVGDRYLILWNIEELAGGDDYDIFEPRSDGFLIGSNGGPTAYAYVDGNYMSVPFVFAGAWQDEARILGRNFEEFVTAIENGEGW
jgi:hypothetical protein